MDETEKVTGRIVHGTDPATSLVILSPGVAGALTITSGLLLKTLDGQEVEVTFRRLEQPPQ